MGNNPSNNFQEIYNENLKLKKENLELKNKLDAKFNKINMNNILNKTIDNYVNNMPPENKICYFCPKDIEKKIYKNTCGIMLCFFKEISNDFSVNFLNHKIEINLKDKNIK